MGMRRNDLPFELRFYLHRTTCDSHDCVLAIMDDFVEDPDEAESSYVKMREFSQVEVELVAKTPGPWRLYLDGLERCDDPNIQADERGCWLPEGKKIALSCYDAEEPWIPGYYDVLVCSKEKRYYNLLYVCPKGMSTHQLDLMRQEIEEIAAGLAMNMVGYNTVNLSAQDYHRFQLLWQNFPQLCGAVMDILKRPSQQAARDWRVVPQGSAKRIGPQSIRWLARHPENMVHSAPRRILSGKSKVLYDLPENRWLAGFLDQIIAFLGKVAAIADGERSRRAEHMREQLRALRKKNPLGELEGEGIAWSLTMFKDGRYRLLYELWRQVFKPSSVHFRGKLGWKRTDLLFEYWCYLRTIVALQELGFNLTGGTLLEGQLEKEGVVVSLAAGTKVELVRGRQKVVVTYNEPLPRTTDEARDKGHFLRMVSPHNQPDIRLDFYENGAYSYTAILDAKYRHPGWLWDRRAFTGERKWPQAMEQISGYKNSLYNIKEPNLRCVREAAIICPPAGQALLDYAADFNLALVMEKPGGGEVLRKYLAEKVIA